jgi:hypothetical protein
VLHAEDEDPAAQVTHLLDLFMKFFPGADPTGDEPAHLLASVANTDVQLGPGSIDDHVWVEAVQRGLGVSAAVGVVRPPHDLDVLLRHRPRSISPRTSAFHAKRRFPKQTPLTGNGRRHTRAGNGIRAVVPTDPCLGSDAPWLARTAPRPLTGLICPEHQGDVKRAAGTSTKMVGERAARHLSFRYLPRLNFLVAGATSA